MEILILIAAVLVAGFVAGVVLGRSVTSEAKAAERRVLTLLSHVAADVEQRRARLEADVTASFKEAEKDTAAVGKRLEAVERNIDLHAVKLISSAGNA